MAIGLKGKEHRGSITKIVSGETINFKSLLSKETISKIPKNKNLFLLCDNSFAIKKLIENNTCVDLIYTDPPYNTQGEFVNRDNLHSYSDTFDQDEYFEYLKTRFELMSDLLNKDGSIYVHIGYQFLGEMKLILDRIFGKSNFRNLITRKKCSSKNSTKKNFPDLHDYILYYSKSKNFKFFQQGINPSNEWIKKEYPKEDSKGKYKLVPIHAPGIRNGDTGKEWRGISPPPGKHWQLIRSKLDALDKEGEIHWSKNGNPRRKVRLTQDKKIPFTNYWSDFRDAHHQSIQITGYPTEKNIEMLKLIINTSSEKGDLIFDPFCGSGSLLGASNYLDRRWIGVDNSLIAASHTLKRLIYGTESMGDFVTNKKMLMNVNKSIILEDFDFLLDGDLKDVNSIEDLISLIR